MYWLLHLPDGEVLYKFDWKIDTTKYTFYTIGTGIASFHWTDGDPAKLPWTEHIKYIYPKYHLYLKKVKNV